jgi:putative membrane protein
MKALYTYWQWDAVTLVCLALLSVFYLGTHHFKIDRTIKSFVAVLLVLVLCFLSPLHVLAAQYLFSAHMVVHVLLLLVVGPLLTMSFSKSWLQQHRWPVQLSRLLQKKPFLSWMLGVGIMWFWHLPFVFNYSMATMHMDMPQNFHWLHAVENSSLIVSGMLFSWPLLTPVKQYRILPLSSVVYLFTACIGCSLLGLLITFAPSGMYQHFLSMHDPFHLNTVIVNQWHIRQSLDQQVAGLIMWVPCCVLYVVYALYLVHTWLNEKDAAGRYVLPDR